MNRVAEMTQRALAILEAAIVEHRPSHVFGLFSGGHDSVCSTKVASMVPQFTAAAHINTTIGIAETRRYARETAAALGWRLIEKYPPKSYRDMCLEHGMPGPGAHLYCYTRLKERCVDELVREHKRHRRDRIVLVTGVRLHESRRRMGHVVPIERRGCQVWVNPCLEFTDEDKEAFIAAHQLPRNPVVDEIGMSGECLCGSFASPGELAIVAEAFPETGAEIASIEQACASRGVHAVWGTRPSKVDRFSMELPGIPKRMPMCANCDRRKVA